MRTLAFSILLGLSGCGVPAGNPPGGSIATPITEDANAYTADDFLDDLVQVMCRWLDECEFAPRYASYDECEEDWITPQGWKAVDWRGDCNPRQNDPDQAQACVRAIAAEFSQVQQFCGPPFGYFDWWSPTYFDECSGLCLPSGM